MTQQLITRKEWGARESDGFDDRPMPIKEWWLHHTVTVAPDLLSPFTDDDAAIRTLERIGEERFGGGVPYTYPVTPVGRIYQGHSLHRRGAHTKGHNTVGAAFAFVGNYDKRSPLPAMEEAVARRMVIDCRAGRALTYQLEGGHRDVSQTACPGAAAYARISAINKRARTLWAAGYPATPSPKEDDMPLTADDVEKILNHDSIPSPMLLPGNPNVTVRSALSFAMQWSLAGRNAAQAAARDAAVARALAEDAALKGEALTPAEIEAAAERGAQAALDARTTGAEVTLEVNQ
jgi:hypothetical protein